MISDSFCSGPAAVDQWFAFVPRHRPKGKRLPCALHPRDGSPQRLSFGHAKEK